MLHSPTHVRSAKRFGTAPKYYSPVLRLGLVVEIVDALTPQDTLSKRISYVTFFTHITPLQLIQKICKLRSPFLR